MTFTPQYNVYADKNGVATLSPGKGENTLVIAAGSPVSSAEAERLKLPELETLARDKAAKKAEESALKPAVISATDAKAIAKTGAVEVPMGLTPNPNEKKVGS